MVTPVLTRSSESSGPCHGRCDGGPSACSRSTNAVLIARLTFDIPNARSTAAIVPKTTRVPTSTTRPFLRLLVTVA